MLMGLGERRFALQAAPTADLKNPIFRKQKTYCPGVLVVEGPKWQEHDTLIGQLLDEEAVQALQVPQRIVQWRWSDFWNCSSMP